MTLLELDDEKGYPWRASMTKRARCYCCAHFIDTTELESLGCKMGHALVYPLYNGEHNCPDFIFEPDPDRVDSVDNDPFRGIDFPECETCTHNFKGVCDGKRWIPVEKKDGKCEFWRDASLICKNAIPILQYGNHFRNNFCKLPPYLRDGDSKRGWKWMCPEAHTKGAESKRCYKPIAITH